MSKALPGLGLAALLVSAACAPVAGPVPPVADDAVTYVEVSVSYRERILMPPGSTLTVRVEDVSLADARAGIIAERIERLDRSGPPYAVRLTVPDDRIDPRHTYAVRAELRDPEGHLRFTTDTRHAVLTHGAANSASIVMVSVR